MKTYAMMVLGCKVNDYESHHLKQQLDEDGYTEVGFDEKADVYIVYTCCVTNIAESKTRKYIRRIKNINPEAYVVVVGCYVQAKPDTEVFSDIDLLVGSSDKDKIKEYIDKKERANLRQDVVSTSFEDLCLTNYKDKTRAYLKVQDGCNQFCTYCIIPYARGRERSASFAKVVAQAKELAKSTPEIVLTGIHTGRYRDGENDLATLLKELIHIEGLKTVRLSSIEINEVNDDIIVLMKENDVLAHHLHIPLQAGSDNILKAMRRPYDIAIYKKRIAEIRAAIPDILISTDLIVGFPGESEEDFVVTLENLRDIAFSFVHCFPYAKKDGTLASRIKEQIPGNIKKERAKRVANLQAGITDKVMSSYLDKTVKVLTETMRDDFTFGHSKEYLPVLVMGRYESGRMLDAKIKKVKDGMMIAEVIESVIE